MQKNCQNTIFGSSRISFHFLNSIFQGSKISFYFLNSILQGSRFSFQFLNSIFKGSRISFRFLNFCQECYYFQKLVGVVVFTKVGSLDLCKFYYSHVIFGSNISFLTKIKNRSSDKTRKKIVLLSC